MFFNSKAKQLLQTIYKIKKNQIYNNKRTYVKKPPISGKDARVCAVLGSQFGDEGKGKLADVLAKEYDIVARFNGGANAGHTVVANGQKFAFHLLPCGLIYPHTKNILGNGVVVDFSSLDSEGGPLDDIGLSWRDRLFISDRAHILFDFHKIIDGIHEERRGDESIGTTKKGIGPAYTSKAIRNGIRVGQLLNFDSFAKSFRELVEWHQSMYGFDYDVEKDLEKYAAWKKTYGHMIIDGVHFINNAYDSGKRIIAEGANALGLDLDFGTFPFVTSSTTSVGGLSTGLGLAPGKIDCSMGVAKAYATRVGWGPFPTELTSTENGGYLEPGAPGTDIGNYLQTTGFEIGVTTKRKRRCGWLDIPVLQYSNMINDYSSINLTKLDVLDGLDEIKLAVAYKIGNRVLAPGEMPSTLEELGKVTVEYESMPGWKQSIEKCKTFEELPSEAQHYVTRIEELVETPITWIGTGPGREEMATHFETRK